MTAAMITPSDALMKTSELSTQEAKRQFDLKVLRDAFVTCVQSDHTLVLREYVRAYEELCTFVSSLGTIFEWATNDLSLKLNVLKEHERLDPVNYHSIQSMIAYEVESGRVLSRDTPVFLPSGKPLPNGSRTLLRLHRALAFISAFLSEMRTASDDASSASIAWSAYSATMARFHSWPVRYTIHAALKLTLPNRQDLINKLLTERTPDEINVFSDEIIQSCNIIERTTHELFRKNGLTKLA
ncbi:unnamed protein product [Adineta ricciae]|uniref:Glycolipid transfer protein domain-containing protein n=1 Tax=Adineta ricciae TaxID=249248 RepID=A0A815ZJB2_ADIRI|nr:unnamed protein product [Adineta ricciae]